MSLAFRFGLALLLVALALVVFQVVGRDYRQRGRAGALSILLECVVFGLHGASWYAFGSDRSAPIVSGRPGVVVATTLFIAGAVVTLLTMGRLGWLTSFGTRVSGLRQTGIYRCSRNPQLVAYTVAVAGCALTLSWTSALLWVGVYLAIAHTMVRTEETHLGRVFGPEYARYCERTPRYLGRWRRQP